MGKAPQGHVCSALQQCRGFIIAAILAFCGVPRFVHGSAIKPQPHDGDNQHVEAIAVIMLLLAAAPLPIIFAEPASASQLLKFKRVGLEQSALAFHQLVVGRRLFERSDADMRPDSSLGKLIFPWPEKMKHDNL